MTEKSDQNTALDEILQKISLAFGADSVELIFPEDMLVDLSLYSISKIHKEDIEQELVFQSKIYMLFETILAYVTDKYVRVDALLKQLESRLSMVYEKQLVSSGDRVSDKKIEKLVEMDEQYTEAVTKKLHYKNLVTTFANIATGLECKKDMLLQLSAKRRAEMRESL